MSGRHLFILPPGLYRGANEEEIEATARGLKEMDLYHLPYERDVFVQMPWSDCVVHQGQYVEFSPNIFMVAGPFGQDQVTDAVLINTNTGVRESLLNHQLDVRGETETLIKQLCMFLVVLLATRNVVKTTKQNKLAKLGIGKKKFRNRFDYTTTISIPADLEDDPDHPGSGSAKAPHLRRGHIRRQHYGPGNHFVKKVWITPVLVNADPDFVNQRAAYNVAV